MKCRFVAGGTSSPVTEAGNMLHRLLLTLQPAVHAIAATVTNRIESELVPGRFLRPVRSGFTVTNTADAVNRVTDLNDSARAVRELRRKAVSPRGLPPAVDAWLSDEWSQRATVAADTHFGVRDFASLFTTLRHELIKVTVGRLLRTIYGQHHGCVAQIARQRLPPGRESEYAEVWVRPDAPEPRRNPFTTYRRISLEEALELLSFIVEGGCVTLGDLFYTQKSGIAMGSHPSPDLSNWLLMGMEEEGLRKYVAQIRSTALGVPILTPAGVERPMTDSLRRQLAEYV
jgi:hypothetical protein